MEITTYKNLEETCYQILEVLQPEEGLTSFNKDNSGNVPGEKKRKVCFERIPENKSLRQISNS